MSCDLVVCPGIPADRNLPAPACAALFPFRPGSARVFALLERGFRGELAVFVVNSDLNLVEVFRSLLTAGIGVRSGLFRDGCLVACGFFVER